MKFYRKLNIRISLLIKLFVVISFAYCNNDKSNDHQYNTFHLSQLVFGENKPIADLQLLKRIHSNVLYETWEVFRQEKDARRPYIAHIFKYNLNDKFPMQNSDLKLFCLRINEFNIEMIRSLPCHDYGFHNKTINDGVVSYVLLQTPKPGKNIQNICKLDQQNIRLCRYNIKQFIKGFCNAHLYSVNSKNQFEVSFMVNKNALYFGGKGKTKGTINQDNSQIREILTFDKQKEYYSDMQNENDWFYLMVPFFKFHSPETIKGQTDLVDNQINLFSGKQIMVYFGKLLTDMYKSFGDELDNGFNPADSSFNPNLLRFNNYTEVFLYLHRNEKTQKLNKFFDDAYMGISNEYTSKLKSYLGGSLTNQQKIKEMDDVLINSYAGFISKLVNFDENHESQFDTFENALKHPFLTGNINENSIRSDTSFEI